MKVKVERHAYALGRFKTVTPIVAAWFMENWLEPEYADLFGGFPLLPDSEGYLTYKTPFWGGREKFPWISMTDDFGDLVHGILLNPVRWNRRLVQGTSDVLSSAELVNTFVSCKDCLMLLDGQRSANATSSDSQEGPLYTPYGPVPDENTRRVLARAGA